MRLMQVHSSHAENLADGAMVAPGDLVEVDETDDHNKLLIERGKLREPEVQSQAAIGETHNTGEEH